MAVGKQDILSTEATARVRDHVPLLEETTYLNSASSSPLPIPVIEEMARYYTHTPVNYRSGETPFERKVTARIDAIRGKFAESLGAVSPAAVVFTKNTTEAINIVAAGIAWKPGDEVVATPIEHQSNLIPWMRLVEREGVRLRFVGLNPDGRVSLQALGEVLSERTRLVAVHHVSNLLGTIQDIAEISRITHEVGALVFVDAAQSEGRIPVHVQSMGCDFLAGCARKALMGPQGIGFLWGREELLLELEPLSIGGQAAIATSERGYRSDDLPYRHEAGILNTVGVIGLGAAIDYADVIDIDSRMAYVDQLTTSLIDTLLAIEGVVVHSPTDPTIRSGVVSWSVAGRDPQGIARALYERGRIVVAAGLCGSPLAAKFLGVEGVVRSSVHYFNNPDDLEHLSTTLREIVTG